MSFVPDPEWECDEEDDEVEPPALEVEIWGPEIIGEFQALDGAVLFYVYDRPTVPFGFQPPGD